MSTDISDGAALDGLKSVTWLDLAATDLTDNGLKPLAALHQLETLILRDARFTMLMLMAFQHLHQGQ